MREEEEEGVECNYIGQVNSEEDQVMVVVVGEKEEKQEDMVYDEGKEN